MRRGNNFEEMLHFLSSVLPDEVLTEHASIGPALENQFFACLKDYYDRANGKSAEDKLEKMFVQGDETENASIKLMSIHKSKGLGADVSLWVGLVEGVIQNRGRK